MQKFLPEISTPKNMSWGRFLKSSSVWSHVTQVRHMRGIYLEHFCLNFPSALHFFNFCPQAAEISVDQKISRGQKIDSRVFGATNVRIFFPFFFEILNFY